MSRGAAARIAAALAIVATMSAAAAQNLPQPRNHVEDRASVISDGAERQLIAVLAELEQKTGAQVIVLTIDTTGGVPIDDYTLRTAERWKLGQAGKDNGALAVIAVKDRKYWITVGYGLEGRLPDGFAGSIGRDYFRPYFRQGDYSAGVQQGMLAIVGAVAKEYNVQISGAAAPKPGPGRTLRRRAPCGVLPIILLIVAFNIFRSRMGHQRRWGGGSNSWLMWMLLGSVMGGGRRYGGGGGWGGGGFGGGGFGGGSFGGGGGGGFGGGGAGGGW